MRPIVTTSKKKTALPVVVAAWRPWDRLGYSALGLVTAAFATQNIPMWGVALMVLASGVLAVVTALDHHTLTVQGDRLILVRLVTGTREWRRKEIHQVVVSPWTPWGRRPHDRRRSFWDRRCLVLVRTDLRPVVLSTPIWPGELDRVALAVHGWYAGR